MDSNLLKKALASRKGKSINLEIVLDQQLLDKHYEDKDAGQVNDESGEIESLEADPPRRPNYIKGLEDEKEKLSEGESEEDMEEDEESGEVDEKGLSGYASKLGLKALIKKKALKK